MDSERTRGWLAAAVLGAGGALAGSQIAFRLDPTPFWITLFAAITGVAGALTGAATFRGPRAGEWHLGLTGFCMCFGAGVLCLSGSAVALEIALTSWMIGLALQADTLRYSRRKRSRRAGGRH